MCGANCWTDHQMWSSTVAFGVRPKHNREGTCKPTKLNTAKLSTISQRERFKQMYSALAQLEGRKAQNQTRNGQLCSRSHTTQPRYILESHTENMVRPQRRGATDSYEQKRPSPPESVALDPPLHHTKIPADCYKITPVH